MNSITRKGFLARALGALALLLLPKAPQTDSYVTEEEAGLYIGWGPPPPMRYADAVWPRQWRFADRLTPDIFSSAYRMQVTAVSHGDKPITVEPPP